MILDSGICGVFSLGNSGAPGDLPCDALKIKMRSWYGELDYATTPARPDGMQEDAEISLRIRVHQSRAVTSHDVVIFDASPDDQYDITRAYHGVDDESGQPITDLTLKRLVSGYDLA